MGYQYFDMSEQKLFLRKILKILKKKKFSS